MGFAQGKNLVLSLNGVRIHRATCQWARPGHVRRWIWADGEPWPRVQEEVDAMGMRPCSECKPMEA